MSIHRRLVFLTERCAGVLPIGRQLRYTQSGEVSLLGSVYLSDLRSLHDGCGILHQPRKAKTSLFGPTWHEGLTTTDDGCFRWGRRVLWNGFLEGERARSLWFM